MAMPAGIQLPPEFRRSPERRTQYHFPLQLQVYVMVVKVDYAAQKPELVMFQTRP